MSFQLRRLRITAGPDTVFDERFYHGVNLIEGENSSGKSTLFKLLYHGIGGAVAPAQWTEAALRCDRVMVECAVGETILTLSRPIEGRSTSPVLVLSGEIEDAIKSATLSDWQEYPYSRSENKQSISQLLFSLLKWPEAFSEQGDFLTFNQFLRAHYADQESPNTTVLKYEDQFDKPTTRESIGNFLLGGSDQRLGQRERALRELEAEYGRVSGAASAGVQLIGGEFDELNLPALQERRGKYEAEAAELEAESISLMKVALQPLRKEDVDRQRLQQVTSKISELKKGISESTQKISQIQYDIYDSDLFISTLNARIRYLTESATVADEFGPIGLDFCPACGTTVSHSAAPEACYLCKSTLGDEAPERRFFSMINSSQSQIEQSRRLQKNRKANVQKLEHEVNRFTRELEEAAIELEQQEATVVSTHQARLATVQSRLGFIRSELERLARDQTIILKLQGLRDRRDQLSRDIEQTREEIESLRSASNIRVANSLARVSAETLGFLHADMERQEGFHQSSSVEIDYRNNRFSLSGIQSLSASSTAYMRNAVFLGELFAANVMLTMRHLKLLLLENLEDKGMEPARYYNLHRSIVSRSKSLTGPWQIIISTADWAPDITVGFTRVGRKFTHSEKALRLPPPI